MTIAPQLLIGVSDEVRALVRFVELTGVPHRVTSTINHSLMTNAGNPSRHVALGTNGRGLAIDVATPSPSRDSEGLAAIYRALLPESHALHELIYAGPQVATNIKSGRTVPKYAVADHHDHVHISVYMGVLLVPPHASTPTTMHHYLEDDMSINAKTTVDSLDCPHGDGWYELEADGGVRTEGGCSHFYGSYFSLSDHDRNNPERRFLSISRRRDRQPGYTIYANDGTEGYTFGPGSDG